MGQQDIINFLKEERKFSEKFFTAKEIEEGLCKQGVSVLKITSQLGQLIAYNLIEWKGVGIWQHRKIFRYKKPKTS